MKKIFFRVPHFLLLLIIFVGCSSYVSKIHQQLDDDEKSHLPTAKADKFGLFRQKGSLVSSQDTKVLLPPVERQYQDDTARKRYAANDLNDNSNEGSLWYGYGQENFLFSKNKTRKIGDIIIVKVMENLKKEIGLELSRAFPIIKVEKKKEDKDKKETGNLTSSSLPPTAEKKEELTSNSSEKGVYDNISCVITEEIDKEHLLLKGRKDVLYRNRKRLIEVQALITTREIQDDDTVSSNNVIESSVTALR